MRPLPGWFGSGDLGWGTLLLRGGGFVPRCVMRGRCVMQTDAATNEKIKAQHQEIERIYETLREKFVGRQEAERKTLRTRW